MNRVTKSPRQLEQESENILVINSIEDLVFFSYDVTNGNTYEGKTVKLANNLDFSSDKSYINPNTTNFQIYGYEGNLKQALTSKNGFMPIGSQDGINNFYGTFEGNNKVISSLYINRKSEERIGVGLFVSSYGVIQNLGLINVNIAVEGKGDQSVTVGGITARGHNANIYNCYVTGNIKASGEYWMPVGGLCGVMQEKGNIENCYNLAKIECKNTKSEEGNADIGCGGILGQGKANINKCYNRGEIVANGGHNQISAGGLCGHIAADAIIKNSYNSAKVEANTTTQKECYVGGILGASNSSTKIEYCYNSGKIVGNANRLYIAGIVSRCAVNRIVINNVYNIGEIESQQFYYVGGIIGRSIEEGMISNAYNIGMINVKNSSTTRVGSIAGDNGLKIITFNNCYYLKGTYEKGVGIGDANGIVEIQNAYELPTILEVINKEDAFLEDKNNKNGGYPVLKINK